MCIIMSKEGTLIKTRYPVIYFPDFEISNKEQLKYKKDDIKKSLEDVKENLLSLCMSTPKDIYNEKEYDSPFDYVKQKFNSEFDELNETLYGIHQLDFMEDLINEWEYPGYDSKRELYDNDINNAFREDKKEEIKPIDKHKFVFSPDDKSLLDVFNRAKKNIEYNRSNLDFLKDKYVILFDNEIFVTENDQFIFNSEENARKVLYDKFDLRFFDYLTKDFILLNREFFLSFNNVLSDDDFNKLIEKIDEFSSSDGKYNENTMTLLNDILELLQEGIYSMFESHIQVIKLYDLVYKIKSVNNE